MEKKNPEEINQYKLELEKKKNFYRKNRPISRNRQENYKRPEYCFREIDSVNSITPDEKQIAKENNSDVQLNVNDREDII